MLIQSRDFDILLWLVHMKFSTLEQITEVFFKGNNPHRAPYRRLLKLMAEGLIETRKVYTDRRDLYVPTRKALNLLRSEGFVHLPALPKAKLFQNFDHDKGLIDLRIFCEGLGLGTWVPERVIRSIKPRGTAPDALLITWDTNYAIEYELSEKNVFRYKLIFSRYSDKEKYDCVLYILPTERRVQRLKEKMGYIGSKIYFASEEKLREEKENTVFFSSSDGLPLKKIIHYSTQRPVEDYTREELKEIIQADSPDDWKDRKPFVDSGGGGKSKNKNGGWGEHDTQDSSSDPRMYPAMYPNEEDQNEHHDLL